jgi:hypothetical protein
MQAENNSSYDFSYRTDRLAQQLGVTLRELGPKIGISPGMFFGYRTGRYEVSMKSLRKLEAAERAVGLPLAQTPTNSSSEGPQADYGGPHIGFITGAQFLAGWRSMPAEKRLELAEQIAHLVAKGFDETVRNT